MNAISPQAARLKKIRLYLGLTREQLSKSITISQYTIRSWENGHKNFTEKSIKRFVSALKKKLHFDCSFEWLMHGTGKSPISQYEEQKSKDIFDELIVDPCHLNILNEVALFKKLNNQANLIAVSNNAFYPLAAPGDYIGLLAIDNSNLKNYIDKMLYLTFQDNASFFGLLKKHQKIFQLIQLSDGTIHDLKISNLENIFQLIWLRKIY